MSALVYVETTIPGFYFNTRKTAPMVSAGFTIEEIFQPARIDSRFLVRIKETVDFENDLARQEFDSIASVASTIETD